jgi:hypothetical protein
MQQHCCTCRNTQQQRCPCFIQRAATEDVCRGSAHAFNREHDAISLTAADCGAYDGAVQNTQQQVMCSFATPAHAL